MGAKSAKTFFFGGGGDPSTYQMILNTYADDTKTSVKGKSMENGVRNLELDAKNVLRFMVNVFNLQRYRLNLCTYLSTVISRDIWHSSRT